MAATRTITVRATESQVWAALRRAVSAASGHGSALASQRRMMVRVGCAALEKISEGFRVRSRYGTDASGMRWDRLKDSTLKRRKYRSKKLRVKPPTWGVPQILRHIGYLAKSLEPFSLPSLARVIVRKRYQVFRISGRSVVVGTSRPWAYVHHKGYPRGKIPKRRLWPHPTRWPPRWGQAILAQVRAGVVDIIKEILGVKT